MSPRKWMDVLLKTAACRFGKVHFFGGGFVFLGKLKISLANLLKFETYEGFKWLYNTWLFVLEASGTSVACYEAPNFADLHYI
jgi:hypothetical protein